MRGRGRDVQRNDSTDKVSHSNGDSRNDHAKSCRFRDPLAVMNEAIDRR